MNPLPAYAAIGDWSAAKREPDHVISRLPSAKQTANIPHKSQEMPLKGLYSFVFTAPHYTSLVITDPDRPLRTTCKLNSTVMYTPILCWDTYDGQRRVDNLSCWQMADGLRFTNGKKTEAEHGNQ